MLKILIATGGTGGHLFPAQQLADQLPFAEVHFAGHKLTSSPFFYKKAPFHEIASAGSLKKWPQLMRGFWQSLKLIARLKPDVVVGFGSFHSFPVLFAALILGKKIVLFEANCSLGKVNRFFAPFAKKVAFQFPIPHPKAVYVPLLPWGKKKEGGRSYSRDPDLFTILVFGGSQGAAFINQTFCQAAKLLPFPFRVIHFTGKESIGINYQVPSIVKPFEEDMAGAYEAADLVICRCGAGTTAELIRFKKPSIVIPYPYAHDHQRKNGEFLKKGTRMILQKEASPERLAREIQLAKENLEFQRAALEQIALPETVDLGRVIEEIGGRR